MNSIVQRHISCAGRWEDIDLFCDAVELAERSPPYFRYTSGYAALCTALSGNNVLVDGIWSVADTEPAPDDLAFIENLFWLLLEEAKENKPRG